MGRVRGSFGYARGVDALCKEGLGEQGHVCGWTEKREGECNPATISGDRKRPTLGRLYCHYSYSLGRQTDSKSDET